MVVAQALLYLLAVILIGLAACRVTAPVSLALLGAGFALAAFALPTWAAATA